MSLLDSNGFYKVWIGWSFRIWTVVSLDAGSLVFSGYRRIDIRYQSTSGTNIELEECPRKRKSTRSGMKTTMVISLRGNLSPPKYWHSTKPDNASVCVKRHDKRKYYTCSGYVFQKHFLMQCFFVQIA